MKKYLIMLLSLMLCLTMVLSLASCGETVNSKVGIQSGTTSEAYAKVLKGVEVVSFDTFALAAQAMKNGNADYVFVDKTTANALCAEIDGLKIIDIALSSEYYGIGIDPSQPSLKVDIDRILAEKAEEIQAIKDKYMNGDEDAYVGFTNNDKDNNNAAGQLVVATNAEFAPWEYKEGNLFYGIDIEIAKLIADELNLELVIEDMQFNMVVGAVGKNGVDIAMSGITITTERQQVINFSTPYYTESIVVVCKATDTTFDSAGTVVDILNAICYPAESDAE